MTLRTFRRTEPAASGAVTTVVIGAGHAGLAVSHCLSGLGIDHVVLERGEVANSWRRERWDSLRLLTPNWQSRLPGHGYAGDDPDGFMTMPELVEFISGYARLTAAPVHTGTTVTSVQRSAEGYRVVTDRGAWRCLSVVLASGAFNVPVVPSVAAHLPPTIRSYTAHAYRNPDELEDGGVLVVGASATGLQLADEIHRSGRPVTVCVGEHVRMPRLYRGLDIQWWMHAAGVLDQRYDELDDLDRARRVPSPQLVGTPERITLDLNTLTDRGVRLVGRLAGIRDHTLMFSGALRNHCALADLKMNRLLDTFDTWAAGSAGAVSSVGAISGALRSPAANGVHAGSPTEDLDRAAAATSPERFAPTLVDDAPLLSLDLRRGAIRSVVWATGFRPDYGWLHVPVLDRKGRLRHDGGMVDAPGMYAMGLTFMRRRKSSFIHGAEDDARDLSAHLKRYLDGRRSASVAG